MSKTRKPKVGETVLVTDEAGNKIAFGVVEAFTNTPELGPGDFEIDFMDGDDCHFNSDEDRLYVCKQLN